MVQTVATAPPTALIIVGSNFTWNKTLCDPQIFVLNLGVLCVRLTYTPARDKEYTQIPNTGDIFKKTFIDGKLR